MAALARVVDDVPRTHRAGTREIADGLHALLFEDVPGDAYAIGCALRDSPRILSVTRMTGDRSLNAVDKNGVVPDFAIFELQPPGASGFERIIKLGAKLRVLYADPAAAGMPVVVFTSPSNDTGCAHGEGANTNIVDLAARLDGIIQLVVPRSRRS